MPLQNRYEDRTLVDYNKAIINASPIQVLRFVAAHEFRRLYPRYGTALEIGCGEGDSAEPILDVAKPDVMILLDESAEMIRRCKKNLMRFDHLTKYVCEDALEYLHDSRRVDLITSSWTIHNFTWKEKEKLFRAVYNGLVHGGSFLLMDKVYPDRGAKRLLDIQCRRYEYLPPFLATAITEHEKEDFLPKYRMEQKQLISCLSHIGFCDIKIVDRVERDIVLVARKE